MTIFFGVPCWIDSSCLRIVLTEKSLSSSTAVLPPRSKGLLLNAPSSRVSPCMMLSAVGSSTARPGSTAHMLTLAGRPRAPLTISLDVTSATEGAEEVRSHVGSCC